MLQQTVNKLSVLLKTTPVVRSHDLFAIKGPWDEKALIGNPPLPKPLHDWALPRIDRARFYPLTCFMIFVHRSTIGSTLSAALETVRAGPWCVLSFEAVPLLRQRGYRVRRHEDCFPE